MADKSFWEVLGPGLLETGGNIYTSGRASSEAEKRLRRAQGPLFDVQQGLAAKSLANAGSMDPKAAAAEWFAAQQGLVAPSNLQAQQNLMQELQAKGMLGLASHSAVPGTAPTPGVAMNPQLAALFAAQEGAKQKSAYQSLAEGEAQLDRMIDRSDTLQGSAQRARATGQYALTQVPAKPSIMDQLLKGGLNILKDPRARRTVGGMLGDAAGWLGGALGIGSKPWTGDWE